MGILQRINNRINRNPYYLDFKHRLEEPTERGSKRALSYYYYLNFKYFLKGIYYRKDFKDIRTMVLTIGFNRSGSSLLGYLLTAHPNIVIADEIQWQTVAGQINFRFADGGIDYLARRYKDNLNILFSDILGTDQLRYWYSSKISTTNLHNEAQQKYYINRDEDRNNRYVLVPNQYQGRFERLKIIGVKASREHVWALLKNNTLVNLERKLKERDIKLKFLFTVRNPYDLYSRITRTMKRNYESNCYYFVNQCERNENLLKRIDPQDVFVYRHEDMCKDPGRQLARLCDFLEVPIPDRYIEDCASRVVQEPHKGRLDINWSPELKQKIARMIEKYDFLSGYDWET